MTVETQYRDSTSIVQQCRDKYTVDVETTCRHLDGAEVGFRRSDNAEHHRRAGGVEVLLGTLLVAFGRQGGSFTRLF